MYNYHANSTKFLPHAHTQNIIATWKKYFPLQANYEWIGEIWNWIIFQIHIICIALVAMNSGSISACTSNHSSLYLNNACEKKVAHIRQQKNKKKKTANKQTTMKALRPWDWSTSSHMLVRMFIRRYNLLGLMSTLSTDAINYRETVCRTKNVFQQRNISWSLFSWGMRLWFVNGRHDANIRSHIRSSPTL